MALLSDYTTKLSMAFDRQLPAEARAFAPTIMVNDVAAQHVGAIQVLGYIRGALAGGLLYSSEFDSCRTRSANS